MRMRLSKEDPLGRRGRYPEDGSRMIGQGLIARLLGSSSYGLRKGRTKTERIRGYPAETPIIREERSRLWLRTSCMNFLQTGRMSLLSVALNIMTCFSCGVARKISCTSRRMSGKENESSQLLFVPNGKIEAKLCNLT